MAQYPLFSKDTYFLESSVPVILITFTIAMQTCKNRKDNDGYNKIQRKNVCIETTIIRSLNSFSQKMAFCT